MELPELNLKVLFELPLPEILRFCQTSKEYQKLCQDEHFWKEKLERDYPGSTQFKTPDLSYREMYLAFYYFHTRPPGSSVKELVIRSDYLYVLKWLSLTNPITEWDIVDAVRLGALKILEWLLERGFRPPSWALSTIYHCRVGTLSLLERYGVFPDQDTLDAAAKANCVDILEWMYQRGFVPDQSTLIEALKGGAMKSLRWIWDHGVRPEREEDEELTYAAADNDQLESLKWLYSLGIRPTESDLSTVTHYGDLEIAKWMSQLDPPLLPNRELADGLAEGGVLESLEWMSHLNPPVLPTQEGIDQAAKNGHVDILEWAFHLPSPILPTNLENTDDEVREWAESVRERLTSLMERVKN